MAFIAITQETHPQILGVARATLNAERTQAEFAMLIRSDQKGCGIGKGLLGKLVRYLDQELVDDIEGITMLHNAPMIKLAQKLGFKVTRDMEEGAAHLKRQRPVSSGMSVESASGK